MNSDESLWLQNAMQLIEADYARSADTHLVKLDIPAFPNIDIYLKDESTHPTGSLKHRLARSLFLYALSNGWLKEKQPVVEASSGSTAISEAYFAKLIGLPFVAVVPEGTAQKKIDQIEFHGGTCHQVKATNVCQAAAEIAMELGGHFMDQFTFAERATDWRGNNNIADSVFCQMQRERFPDPSWIVMSAGTGGTTSTIGRYLRYRGVWGNPTKLCVVDPENSVFLPYYESGKEDLTIETASRIEGIGRPRVEPSFTRSVVDRMLPIMDEDSMVACHYLSKKLGRKVGGSTGTNFCGVLKLAEEMKRANKSGSIVTLLCDGGDRYLDTYYNEQWLESQGFNVPGKLMLMKSQLDGQA